MAMEQKPTGTIIFSLVFLCLKSGMCYVFKCPYSHTSEWRLRAEIICNRSITTNYQCLFNKLGQYTTKNNNFTEDCTNADFLKQGQKYVTAKGRLGIDCTTRTYQPVRFWSNSSDECEFVKSKCSEEGQIIYNNGFTDTDTTCRCDYSNGYAFITNRASTCYCVPSQEDCSCYFKICSDERKVSKDYLCVGKKDDGRNSNCTEILIQRNKEQKKVTLTQTKTDLNRPNTDNWLRIPITVLIILTIGVIVIGTLIVVGKLSYYCWFELSPVNVQVRRNSMCSVGLFWNKPDIKFTVISYEISYTYDGCTTVKKLVIDGSKRERLITDLIPFKRYRFGVTYWCIYSKNKIQSHTSEEVDVDIQGQSPYNLMANVNFDCSVDLVWSRPNMNFQEVMCKIEYTYDDLESDENKPKQIEVNVDTSTCRIPNVIPFKTYRFKVSYMSQNDEDRKQILSSNEALLTTDSPILRITTNANTSEKCIDITWSKPLNINVRMKTYEIHFTSSDWEIDSKIGETNQSPWQISNIFPNATYRFKALYICSCDSYKKDIKSKPSDEQSIFTGEPAKPEGLLPVWKDGKLNISWSPPVDTLFSTTNYKILVTKDEWENVVYERIQSCEYPLQYILENVDKQELYRFRIYNCASEFLSKPAVNSFFTGVYYRTDIPIYQQYSEDLNNTESNEYMGMVNVLRTTVENLYHNTLGKGLQKVRDVFFRKGSVIAVVILTSEGYHDESMLREVIENPVKSGTLGDFKTFHKGFSFTVLNRPEPPHDITVVIEHTYFVVTWAKHTKSLHENEKYRIEYTSDVWQNKKVENIPDDVVEFKIQDVLPSTNYKFRLFTSIYDSITSHPSTEREKNMRGPFPLYNLKVALVKSTNTGYKLTWDKPVFPSEKHIQMYKLIVNRKERDLFEPGIECSFTWTPEPKEDYNVYTFAVIAYCVNGTESKSDEVTCNMLRAPVPPRNIRVENPSGIKLFWMHTHTPKVECIKHYTIYIKDDGRQPLEPVIVQSPQKSKLINNLKPNHRYTFEVSTCSTENFEGLSSASIESKTGDPLPPKDMKVYPTADGIKLVWSKPEFPVEQYIEKYEVLMSSDDNPYSVFETEDTRFIFERKVKPNTVYEFQCKTYSTNGHESQLSEKVSLDTTVGSH